MLCSELKLLLKVVKSRAKTIKEMTTTDCLLLLQTVFSIRYTKTWTPLSKLRILLIFETKRCGCNNSCNNQTLKISLFWKVIHRCFFFYGHIKLKQMSSSFMNSLGLKWFVRRGWELSLGIWKSWRELKDQDNFQNKLHVCWTERPSKTPKSQKKKKKQVLSKYFLN